MVKAISRVLSVAVWAVWLPLTALAQQDNSSPPPPPSNYSFSVGSRPADIGTGFSTYSATSATSDQQFHIECNCHDFSVAVAICPAQRYECYCSPSASVTCQ